jgi:hypothetical protein
LRAHAHAHAHAHARAHAHTRTHARTYNQQVGIAMFTYAGHAVVPEIHASAKNKEDVGAALTAGFGVVLMIFTLVRAQLPV